MNASAVLRPFESSATRREAAIPRYQGGTIVERYEACWTGIRATLVDVRSQGSVEVDFAHRPRTSS